MKPRFITVFTLLILAAIALTACGGQETVAPPQTEPTEAPQTEVEEEEVEEEVVEESKDISLPGVNPLTLEGDVVTAGSSTVFPLAEAMAARFQDEGFSGKITIDSIGSGGGYERFCVAGETDVSNASRPIKDSEVESCRKIGREPIPFKVGTDALAVTVSQENDFVEDVTFEELALIFGEAETWADVRAEWPDEEIVRYIPGTDSGTFDFFVEEVFDENEEPILGASNNNLSEDDNVLVQGIQGSPYAVGFFGYAYYSENTDVLKILNIEGVEASAASVDSGNYPLARPLFIYSDAEIMQAKPQVAGYINFFLTFVDEEITDVGYFPASDEALMTAKLNWLDAMGQKVEISEEETAEEEIASFDGILPGVNPLALEGDVVTAGSSTVFPLAEAMAARFQDEGFSGKTTIDSIGSGGGYERFCVAGETDVSNASRPIKDSEVESCRKIGREPIPFKVGTDALAVTLSQENDFVEDVTFEELALIFGEAETWADVRAEWPDEEIVRYIPGTDSGTFDFFVEEVFDENEEPILGASNNNLSEDDNVLVQGIQGSPYAVGFFGYAYYSENTDVLKILNIEGVEASAASVDSGDYPLARPLFIYSDAEIMQAKPQVAGYINFFLTFVDEEITDVGYFPASDEALMTAKLNWLHAMDMEVSLPGVNPLALEGDVVTAGSSTVFPLAEAMAARFQDEGFSGKITIDSIGSGGGYERFCVAGETDVSNASRPIKDSEVESCRKIGREPIPFKVGTDALAVTVSQENDFVEDVTFEELALIFGEAETWADVRAEWPDEEIVRYIPGTDSGTFDFFVEEVFDENEEPILGASNNNLSEDDNVLVQGIQGSPYAVGFFGYAYYSENTDVLKILNIEGVEASAASVDSGNYPLARPLFIYSDAEIMQAKPQVAGYINFFLTFVNEEITDVGYFPASDTALGMSKLRFLEAIK